MILTCIKTGRWWPVASQKEGRKLAARLAYSKNVSDQV